jgi:YgiT-type zinc finger domain-containing protein
LVTQCYFCGGKTVPRRVTAENWWGDELALVRGVPAWVCENCEEQYFDAAISKKLDQMRQAPPPAQDTVKVPVYVFSDGDL